MNSNTLWPGEQCARQFLTVVMDGVIEFRVLARDGSVRAGYFNDPESVIRAATALDDLAKGSYVTLNPVDPALLARSNNRIQRNLRPLTGDAEILSRRFVLIDIDPIRRSGVSATEAERKRAFEVGRRVHEFLRSRGFPEPIRIDSGNGAHLLYRVDLPSEDAGLIERFLGALEFRFGNEHASVDASVHNPARITKLPGTMARKGDSTKDRPHRRSRLVGAPQQLEVVPTQLLEEVTAMLPVAEAPQSKRRHGGDPFDLESFLRRHQLEAGSPEPWRGGRRWKLHFCPFNAEHTDRSAYVVQHASGAIAAGCHHSSCAWGWSDLRARYAAATDRTESSNPKSAGAPHQILPAFVPPPVDVLPTFVREFVVDAARSIGCCASFVLLPLLGVLATAIGNTRRVRLKRTWVEPSILWCVIVGESGSQKSPAFDRALALLVERQNRWMKQYEREYDQYQRDLQRYERDLQHWKKSREDCDPPDKPIEPRPRRITTTDTTTEALVVLLADNSRGILLARDELSGWLGSFDAYREGTGGDVACWLEFHRGGSFTVDRKSSGALFVPCASVSVAGGIQPEILKNALGRQHFLNGLAPRLLVAMPPRRPKRWTDDEVDEEVQDGLDRVLGQLLDLECAANGRAESIDLSPPARRAWIRFVNEHGLEQMQLDGDLVAAWAKLEAYGARLALVLHLCKLAAQGRATSLEPIEARTVEEAINLVRWFAGETERVYAFLSQSSDDQKTQALLNLIERQGGSITVPQLMHAARRYRSSADVARSALDDLRHKGLGDWTRVAPATGRPSDVFVLRAADSNDAGNETPGSLGGGGVSLPLPLLASEPRNEPEVGASTAPTVEALDSAGALVESAAAERSDPTASSPGHGNETPASFGAGQLDGPADSDQAGASAAPSTPR